MQPTTTQEAAVGLAHEVILASLSDDALTRLEAIAAHAQTLAALLAVHEQEFRPPQVIETPAGWPAALLPLVERAIADYAALPRRTAVLLDRWASPYGGIPVSIFDAPVV